MPTRAMNRTAECIVCAAILLQSGKIICGVRHFDALMHQQLPQNPWYAKFITRRCQQGFVTSRGRFVDRAEAFAIAFSAGQVPWMGGLRKLYSEDLY